MSIYNASITIDKAYENTKENITYGAKQTGVAAVTAGTGYYLLKSDAVKDKFEKAANYSVTKSADFISKYLPKTKDVMTKAVNTFKAIPRSAKLVGALAAIGGLVMHNISTKHNQTKGEIKQKFEILEKQQDFVV